VVEPVDTRAPKPIGPDQPIVLWAAFFCE